MYMYATHTYMYTRLHMCEYMLVCVCTLDVCLDWSPFYILKLVSHSNRELPV